MSRSVRSGQQLLELVPGPERPQIHAVARKRLEHLCIPFERNLSRAVVGNGELPGARVIQIQVRSLDGHQPGSVALNDQQILHTARAGGFDRLVPGNDLTVLVEQNRASGAVIAQTVLDHLRAAGRAFVRISGVGLEVG